VKLQRRVGEFEQGGAQVLGISIDKPEAAGTLAKELGLTFPLLSDPSMDVIRRYGMKGEAMGMADMGYAVIDRRGRLREKKIDRKFAERVDDILATVRALGQGA